ncbi:MAG: HAD-IIB family hydrolase [Hyphomicrobiales bacterium]
MNNKLDRPFIFFSDLDGTLLDHQTYSHAPAREALDALRANHIELILASSKTAAEIAPLRRDIGFEHCEAIVENGAGLLLSGSLEKSSNEYYQRLLDVLTELPAIYRGHFTGFSQWEAAEISQLTGLTLNAAKLSKARQFSEPGLWSGSDDELEGFRSFLKNEGIIAQRGGRFLTLSFGGRKVDQMQKIIDRHRANGVDPFCVALGDAPNDIAMLEAADLGIIIPNSSHSGINELPGEATGKIIRATFTGPEGWNDAVLNVLR